MNASLDAGLSRRFACLDGYRALAAVAVVIYHVMGRFELHSAERTLGLYSSRLGDYGVTVFFLLSAFLLYRPFALAHLRGTAGPNLRWFFTRRILRIVPAYWVALSVLLFATSYRTVHGLGDYATYYGFSQTYRRGGYAFGAISQAWSLCVEVSFYAALPVLALAARHLWWGDRPSTVARRLRCELYLLGVLFALGMGARWWSLHAVDRFPTSHLWLPALAPLFAAGMLLAVASAWVEVGRRLPAVATTLAEWAGLSWAFAALSYWVLAMVRVPHAFEPQKIAESMYQPIFTGLSAFFLLLPGTLGNENRRGIPAFLRSRPLVGLGLISYGIYLWHTLWIEVFIHLRDADEIADGFWVMLGFVSLLTLASSSASYLLVERPILRLASRRRSRGASSRAVAGSDLVTA